MRQPDDPGQQIIHERIIQRNGDSLFAKFQHAIVIAIALAIGTGLWTMNARLTKVETLLEVLAVQMRAK